AYETTKKTPISNTDIHWQIEPVSLPIAPHLNEKDLVSKLKSTDPKGYVSFADQLAWLQRVHSGHKIDIGCLHIGDIRLLSMPGELFVEYQLAAKSMRPDLHVMMAAYGDYGPAYIGTTVAYAEGGYETQSTSSNVAPETEPILMQAMKKLLTSDPKK
ncbi:MAG: hypothetical protein ABL921_15730, partial [Pirellula sp.]